MLIDDIIFSFTQTDLFLSKSCFSMVWLGGNVESLTPICMNKDEFAEFLKKLPLWRQYTEELRINLSFLLMDDGDRFGVFRRIFLNASSTSGDAYQWLLSLGFIHLTNLTGFYWIYFDQFINIFGQYLNLFLRRLLFSLVYFTFFALAGFKLSFLRSFFLIALKWFFKRSHLKVHQILFLILFVGCDVLFSGFGKVSGVMHYAFALVGGFYVFSERDTKTETETGVLEQQSKLHKKSGLKFHWELSLYSYLSCLIFNLIHGNLSLFTPFISMVTVPLLGAFVFPVFILLMGSYLLFGEWIQKFIRIFFCIVDEGIADLSLLLSKSGFGMLQISSSLALLSVLGGVVVWIFLRVFFNSFNKIESR